MNEIKRELNHPMASLNQLISFKEIYKSQQLTTFHKNKRDDHMVLS